MKKIVFVFFALFLLMFSSCRTLSYTETEAVSYTHLTLPTN